MLKFLAVTGLIALLGASSCTTPAPQPPAPPPAAESTGTPGSPAVSVSATTQALNAVKKGMTTAHQAHGLAADLLRVAGETGYLHGSNAAAAASLLRQSASYLKTGDTALALGDVDNVQDAIDKSGALLSQIHALIGK